MENDLDYKIPKFLFCIIQTMAIVKNGLQTVQRFLSNTLMPINIKEQIPKKRGPVGITGFIRFLKPNTKFDLTLGLFYSGKKTKFDADGKTSPFWTPSPELLKKGEWLSKFKIPIEVKD